MVRQNVLGRAKLKERERAIDLRRKGLTYSEILKQVPVAKSSLSLWLGEVGLTARQEQRITAKRHAAQRRGAEARRQQRISKTEAIHAEAEQQAKQLAPNPLFLVGVSLYWAEGSKQKEWNASQLVAFSNMDPLTHRVMIAWFERFLGVKRTALVYELYIHDSVSPVGSVTYWSGELCVPRNRIRVYVKRHTLRPKRHRNLAAYHGVLKIVVPKSTDYNRQIAAWTNYVVKYVT